MIAAGSATGVFRVRDAVPTGHYESALVLGVPPALRECVLRIRGASQYTAPAEFQLDPHMTVLFLGRMDADRLNALANELRTLGTPTVAAVCEGIGVFRAGATITNLHVRVRRDEPLVHLHEAARAACARSEWKPQTAWTGDRYAPHISILDRIEAPETMFEPPDESLLPRGAIELADLHQIAKRV